MTQPLFASTHSNAYSKLRLAGWNVHYESVLYQESPQKLLQALRLLKTKLNEVDQLLPERVKVRLRQVPIWMSKNSSSGAVYHVSEIWLRMHQRPVAMARGIELQNIDHFLSWTKDQPMLVLHELAHALHHRLFDYRHVEISKAFQAAQANGLYQRVLRYNGSMERAYALTDEREYFAELTEAFFGRNDYFPFNRQELKHYDPVGYEVVKGVWLEGKGW